jgi:Rho termination factor, N-terminal domain
VKALVLGLAVGAAGALLARRRKEMAAFVGSTERRLHRRGASWPRDSEPGAELEQLTKSELYRHAQAAGIAGRSEMTKAELIEALRKRNEGAAGS